MFYSDKSKEVFEINKVVFMYLNKIKKHDANTFFHSIRVSNIAVFLGRQIGLETKELIDIRDAAYLHDLGKIKIPEKVLNKRTSLTKEDRDIIMHHPINGQKMLRKDKISSNQIKNTVACHHEYYDGSGYPLGLKGEDIPPFARIVTIADAFDAMITIRPYRLPVSLEEAKKEIASCSGAQFDPYIVNTLLRLNAFELTQGIYGYKKLQKC